MYVSGSSERLGNFSFKYSFSFAFSVMVMIKPEIVFYDN
jgi:hypothetical protein